MNRSAHILEDNGIIKQSHYTINGQYAFPISPGGKVYQPKSQTEVTPSCYWKLGHIVLCYQIRNLRKPFVYATWVTQFPNLLLMSPHWIDLLGFQGKSKDVYQVPLTCQDSNSKCLSNNRLPEFLLKSLFQQPFFLSSFCITLHMQRHQPIFKENLYTVLVLFPLWHLSLRNVPLNFQPFQQLQIPASVSSSQ